MPSTAATQSPGTNRAAGFESHRPEFLREIERGEEKLARVMRDKRLKVPADTVLIHAQAEHPYIYRLVSGWACRSRVIEDGRTQLILIFLPGDLFAVKSLFMVRHPDDVQALTDLALERVDYHELHALFTSDGDVASRCIMQVMEEERRLHNWVVGLGVGGAEERLAMLLLDLRARLAKAGVIAADAVEFRLPLTQMQLGNYLGLTGVHVNRVLRLLRDTGIVSMRNRMVAIDSPRMLVQRAWPLLDGYERQDPAYVDFA